MLDRTATDDFAFRIHQDLDCWLCGSRRAQRQPAATFPIRRWSAVSFGDTEPFWEAEACEAERFPVFHSGNMAHWWVAYPQGGE